MLNYKFYHKITVYTGILVIFIFLVYILNNKKNLENFSWFSSYSKHSSKGKSKYKSHSFFSRHRSSSLGGKSRSSSHSFFSKHGYSKKDKDVGFLETKGGKDCKPDEKKKAISRWMKCMVNEGMFNLARKTRATREKGMVAICKIIVGDAIKGGSEGEKDVVKDMIDHTGCHELKSCNRNSATFANMFVNGIHMAAKAMSHVPWIKVVLAIMKMLVKYTVGLPIIIMAIMYLTYKGEGAYVVECIFSNTPYASGVKIIGGMWTAAKKFSPSKFKDKTQLEFFSHITSDAKLQKELETPQQLTTFEKFIKLIGKSFFIRNNHELKGIFMKNKNLADALNKVFPDVHIGAHTDLKSCLVDLKQLKYKQTEKDSNLYDKYLTKTHIGKNTIEKFYPDYIRPSTTYEYFNSVYEEEMNNDSTISEEQKYPKNKKHKYKNLSKKEAISLLDSFSNIKFSPEDKKAFYDYYLNFEGNLDKMFKTSVSPESVKEIENRYQ